MTKERASLQFGNFSNIAPRKSSNVVEPIEIEKRATEAGFGMRTSQANKPLVSVQEQEPVLKSPAPTGKVMVVDGRKIRKSKKTTQLNIAVDPELKNSFWALAEELDMDSGGDILAYLIDRYNGLA